MAIRLEFASVIVPRCHFPRCSDLPQFFQEMNAGGGVLMDLLWYDAHLFREGSMSSWDAERDIESWEQRGLTPLRIQGSRKSWRDVCLATSQHGPTLPCDWLEYDAAENCVWMKGTERGPVIGGSSWVSARMEELAALEAKGESALAAIAGSQPPKADFDRSLTSLDNALDLARFLHRPSVEERLKKLRERFRAAYEAKGTP